MKTFKELKVWKKAHELVLRIYSETRLFPDEEKYGLTAQIRRSASSVPTNIVEGHKRKSSKEFSRFLNLADSSLEETKYHLILAQDLGYLCKNNYEDINELCIEVGKMITGLEKKLKADELITEG